jgi:conjugative relaxase-like TrwC/TraI family protein
VGGFRLPLPQARPPLLSPGPDAGSRAVRVLNVGKVRSGKDAKDYFLDRVARSQSDYYTGAGEAPGQWAGAAAAELGIAGEVSEDGFLRILNGAHPDTGARLGGPARGDRVLAYDLTFRAPKSVSLLYALGGPRVSRAVQQGHERALAAALGYLERHAAFARRGHNGTQLVRGSGFIAAVFQHRTSRAGDPLLHSHANIANLTRGPDGRWTALDGRALYTHAKTAGYLYQAVLRRELTRSLGVAWGRVSKGVADVAGIPRELIVAFSRRRQQITRRLAERGEHSAKSAQTAALDTRQRKQRGVSQATLLAGWRQRAEDLGFRAHDLEACLGQAEPQPLRPEDRERLIAELASAQGLTQEASTFCRRDLLRAICERLPGGAELTEIEGLADQLLGADDLIIPVTHVHDELAGLAAGDTIRLADGRAIPARADVQRYSTHELVALEADMIAAAQRRQGEGAGMVPEQVVTAVLASHVGRHRTRAAPDTPPPRLTPDQAAMVEALTTSGDGVQLVNAQAGAGKTFALDAARAAWQAAGYRVLGAALPGRAAEELTAGAGIESNTIAQVLLDLKDPRAPGLGPDTVLVIDEAGMVGTRLLSQLLSAAERALAKIVLVGDTEQLPEIDCGGLFRGLLVRLGSTQLTENRRQVERWERDALELLRAGDAGGAIGRYWQHGRVVVRDSAPALRNQLVADWWAAVDQPEEQPPVMIAARRADVVDLNGRARALMAVDGRLGPQALAVGDQEFAVGDRIVTLRNQRRRLGVANGTRGTVTAVDLAAGVLEVRTDDGRAVRLPRWYLSGSPRHPRRQVDYGYAITGHKSEGMTTDRAFTLGSEDIYKEWGYTAMSRGRLENRLYLVVGGNPLAEELDVLGQPKQDPLAMIVRTLGRSRAKRLALDHLVAARPEAAELSSGELQARLEQAAALLEQRPQPAAQSGPAELRQDQARLRAYQREELSWLVDARERLAQGGLRRSERRRVQAGAGEREQRLAQLGRRLSDVDQRLADLDAQRAAQAAWDRDHAEPLGEAVVFGRELSHRELAEAVQLEQDPPGYLIADLGGRPDTAAGRAAWRAAAIAIQSYRSTHDVEDPASALGPAPTDPELHREWAAAMQLTQTATQAIDSLESPSMPEPHPDEFHELAL